MSNPENSFAEPASGQTVSQTIGQTASELSGAASEMASDLSRQAGEMADQARQRANQVWGDVQDQTRHALEETSVYVRENPVPSLLGALGLGFALGLLVARRDPPSFRERYVDEPLEHSRGMLLGLLVALGSLLRGGLHSASDSAGDLAHKVADLPASLGSLTGRSSRKRFLFF